MLLKKIRYGASALPGADGREGQSDVPFALSLKDVPSVSPFYWWRARSIEKRVRTDGVAEITEAPAIRRK